MNGEGCGKWVMRQRIGVSLTDTSGNIREITYKALGCVLRRGRRL